MILCLENNSQAKWIIFSTVLCQRWSEGGRKYCPNDTITKGIVQFNRSEPSKNTYIFKPKKTLIGTNCRVQKKEESKPGYPFVWSCEKYTPQANLTIMTKGNESLEYVKEDYREIRKRFLKFLYTSSDPSCRIGPLDCELEYPRYLFDAIGIPDSRTFEDCRGSAEYCNKRYDFKL
jgi:hypothetical protein